MGGNPYSSEWRASGRSLEELARVGVDHPAPEGWLTAQGAVELADRMTAARGATEEIWFRRRRQGILGELACEWRWWDRGLRLSREVLASGGDQGSDLVGPGLPSISVRLAKYPKYLPIYLSEICKRHPPEVVVQAVADRVYPEHAPATLVGWAYSEEVIQGPAQVLRWTRHQDLGWQLRSILDAAPELRCMCGLDALIANGIGRQQLRELVTRCDCPDARWVRAWRYEHV